MSAIKKLVLCLLAAVFLLASCSKEGPQGPAGPQGEQGIAGEKGDKGETGSANVIYSDWFSFDFQWGVYYGVYYAKIDAPKLTQSILDRGFMKVYVKAGPNVYDIPNPTFDGLYVSYSVGYIEFFSPSNWDNYEYRYMLLPGAIAARKIGAAPDYKDYYAVCKFYHIPE